jgi:hypothetical protein
MPWKQVSPRTRRKIHEAIAEFIGEQDLGNALVMFRPWKGDDAKMGEIIILRHISTPEKD